MSRRRGRQGLEVSLFPFLSVLACVIGTLTLILASMAISQVSSSALDGVRLGEELNRIQQALVEQREERAELEEELETAQAADADQDQLHERLNGLGLDPDLSLEDLDRLVNERRSASEAAVVESNRARLLAERRRLDEQLQGVRAEVNARESATQNLTMRIAPSGAGRSYRPYFAECAANYLQIHTVKSDFKFKVPREDLDRGENYQKFLKRIKLLRGSQLVFLVRPEGVATCKDAIAKANRLGVESSKMPLPGDGELDFSMFDDGSTSAERR